MERSLRSDEPWFVPLGLLVLGGVGVMYHQLLLWCWRLGGVGPVDRRTFGGALLLLGCGALVSWQEGRGLRLLRRFALALAIGAGPCLHWAWRSDLLGGAWGWGAIVACGLCGGGEAYWLFRALWKSPTASSQATLVAAQVRPGIVGWWLLSLVLPSMAMPYVGILPGCLVYAGVILGWSLWSLDREAKFYALHTGEAFRPMKRLPQLAGAGWAACIACYVATPGIHVSAKGYLPVDRERSGALTMETSRRVDVLWLRGSWRNARRWEYFSSDAHRWAEALVHPVMIGAPAQARVLLLGGEDGTALREILRHVSVGRVDAWSDRPQRLEWLTRHPLWTRRLGAPFRDPRVAVTTFANRGSMLQGLATSSKRYHRIIVALDRPWRGPSGRRQMSDLFQRLRQRSAVGGRLAGFWGELKPLGHYACMLRSVTRAGWKVRPYRSLGTGISWGLFVAGQGAVPALPGERLPAGLRYLSPARFRALLRFPPDADPARAATVDCDE